MQEPSTSEEWLRQEEERAKAERVKRLNWMAGLISDSEPTYLVQGGMIAARLFDEARYCYAFGQYLAVIVLGVAFIEMTIAAKFYAAGRSEFERAGGLELLKAARDEGWISSAEMGQLDQLRQLRNPVVHYRRPLASDAVVTRAVEKNCWIDEVLEEDARNVLVGALKVLRGDYKTIS